MNHDKLIALVAELAADGIYEPGKYVKNRADLRATDPVRHPDGSVTFYVDTNEPNTDSERVKVTVSA